MTDPRHLVCGSNLLGKAWDQAHGSRVSETVAMRRDAGAIELGIESTAAVREVRVVRPGAIETREQEKCVWVST
jgi:hypothetical protein